MHSAVRSPLMTGVALIGAGALAVSPVVVTPEKIEIPALPALASMPVSLTASTDPFGDVVAIATALLALGEGIATALPPALETALTELLALNLRGANEAVLGALIQPAFPALIEILPRVQGLLAIVTGDELAEVLSQQALLPALLPIVLEEAAVGAVSDLLTGVIDAAQTGDPITVAFAVRSGLSGIANTAIGQTGNILNAFLGQPEFGVPGPLGAILAAALPDELGDVAALVNTVTGAINSVSQDALQLAGQIVNAVLGPPPAAPFAAAARADTFALTDVNDSSTATGDFVSVGTDEGADEGSGDGADAGGAEEGSGNDQGDNQAPADNEEESTDDDVQGGSDADDDGAAADDDGSADDMTDGNKTEPGDVNDDNTAGSDDDGNDGAAVDADDDTDGTDNSGADADNSDSGSDNSDSGGGEGGAA